MWKDDLPKVSWWAEALGSSDSSAYVLEVILDTRVLLSRDIAVWRIRKLGDTVHQFAHAKLINFGKNRGLLPSRSLFLAIRLPHKWWSSWPVRVHPVISHQRTTLHALVVHRCIGSWNLRVSLYELVVVMNWSFRASVGADTFIFLNSNCGRSYDRLLCIVVSHYRMVWPVLLWYGMLRQLGVAHCPAF